MGGEERLPRGLRVQFEVVDEECCCVGKGCDGQGEKETWLVSVVSAVLAGTRSFFERVCACMYVVGLAVVCPYC